MLKDINVHVVGFGYWNTGENTENWSRAKILTNTSSEAH